MKISILLLLIGSILSSNDYDDQYYHFYDITFNERYYVDMSKYTSGFLPANHHYYFRLGVIPNDKMEIQCTVQRYAVSAFKVDVCPFFTQPTNNEVYHGNQYCANGLAGEKTEYNTYDRYTYPFTTTENVHYLAVHLQNYYSLDYLDVYIYSESGWGASLILLVILLPCIIIAAVVMVVLKFCCGCNFSFSSGGGVRSNMI